MKEMSFAYFNLVHYTNIKDNLSRISSKYLWNKVKMNSINQLFFLVNQ